MLIRIFFYILYDVSFSHHLRRVKQIGYSTMRLLQLERVASCCSAPEQIAPLITPSNLAYLNYLAFLIDPHCLIFEQSRFTTPCLLLQKGCLPLSCTVKESNRTSQG